MNPEYPVYIVSKGRWKQRLTARVLERMRVPFRVVVEPQEYPNYAEHLPAEKLLTLPFGNLGTGPTPARNWIWEHSLSEGWPWHWILDDNIEAFYRMNHNQRPVVESGTIFKAAEDFVGRYENVALAGFNYHNMCKMTDDVPAFYLNTRIYSCLLIRNDIPYRWRGRYNEDTDLSLRALKDGWCTVLFNAFLAGKITTQRMRGGCTEVFYEKEGTLPKSQMLADEHPDVARVVWRFNRWHHYVDYRPFKKNKLIRKKGLVIPEGVNNYGMVLRPYVRERGQSET